MRLRLTALALLAIATPARAADPAVEEVQQCMRRNLPGKTARQQIALEATDASGSGQRLQAELAWRRGKGDRSEVLVRVEAPPDLRGSAFLLIEREGGHEMFSYLPELKKVRRISGHAISGSLFGTDFSYEDFQRLQGTVEGTVVSRLPDADVDGRPAYVLAVTPAADSGSSYQRIVTWIDRETCVALRSDLEAGDGRVVKQLRADPAQVRDVAGHRVPHAVVLEDLEKGTRTTLTVLEIDLDVELSPSLFSEAALAKGR